MQTARTEALLAMRRDLDAVAGGAGRTWLVRGAAGIGKSYLAERFVHQLPAEAVALVGRAPPTGSPPLMPLCRALAAERGNRVGTEVTTVLAEYSQSVPILKEALGPLMRARRTLQFGPLPADIAPREAHTFFVLSEMLRRVGRRQPTVFCLDDIQWLDASSTAFLGFLADELRTLPILLLLLARTNGAEAEAVSTVNSAMDRRSRGFVSYEVPPLSVPETVHVAERALQEPLACTPDEAMWLHDSTRGVPQYVREVVALLRERGDLIRDRTGWHFARPPENLVLPPSLRATVIARLDAAFSRESDLEALIQLGAVSGVNFDARLVARAVGVALPSAMGALRRFSTTTGLVRRVGRSTVWAFDHALTREAALEQTGDVAADLHLTLANLLAREGATAPIEVAHHYRAARAWQPAARYYHEAAQLASRRFAYEEGAAAALVSENMLTSAGEPLDSTQRLAVAAVGAECLVNARKYTEAIRRLEPIFVAASQSVGADLLKLLARAKLNLAEAESHAEAVSLLRAAARRAHDAPAAARVWTELVFAFDAVGEYHASQAAFRRAASAAHAGRDSLAQIRLLRLTCVFWQPDRVIEATSRALRLARSHKFAYEAALCLNNLGAQHWYRGDLPKAVSFFEESAAALRACGRVRLDVPTSNLGLVALAEGRLVEAAGLLERALAISLVPADRLLIRSNIAVVHAESGGLERAVAELRVLAAEADRSGDPFHRDCVRYNLARALLSSGKPGDAANELLACPPRHWITDDELINAKRERLLLEAESILGRQLVRIRGSDAVLDGSTKAQVWLYRLPWELCDIQFWQD